MKYLAYDSNTDDPALGGVSIDEWNSDLYDLGDKASKKKLLKSVSAWEDEAHQNVYEIPAVPDEATFDALVDKSRANHYEKLAQQQPAGYVKLQRTNNYEIALSEHVQVHL